MTFNAATFGFGGIHGSDSVQDNYNAMAFRADDNRGVTPEFILTEEPDIDRARTEGRPCFRDRETVLLHVAGDPLNTVSRPVDAEVIARFPEQYKLWKANRDQSLTVSGTPLRQWPVIGPAQVRELEALHVYNVEGLARIAEVNIARSPSLRELRAKAEAWLKQAEDGAEVTRLAEELQKRDDIISELRDRFDIMQAQVSAIEQGKSKKHAA